MAILSDLQDATQPIRVFISYSHDSPDHLARIKALADSLQKESDIDCVLDQYVPGAHPPDKWPAWMQRQAKEATKVLMVCTERYFRLISGENVSPAEGRGSHWESELAIAQLYDAKGRSTKFKAVLPDGGREDHVPPWLKGWGWLHLPDCLEGDDYRSLLNFLREGAPDVGPGLPKRSGERPPEPPKNPATPASPARQPFLGLRAFTEQDADYFFGREAYVRQFTQACEEPARRLLLVAGASGSGKSSLVRAGLLPALAETGWPKALVFTPTGDPYGRLALRLGDALGRDEADLRDSLTGSADALRALVACQFSGDRASCLLLVIDQLEELFTETPAATADRFLRLLAAALSEPGLRLVATVRADFLDRCLAHPEFGPLVEENTRLVRPPDGVSLQAMIEGPAAKAGLALDDKLAERIVLDLCDADGRPEPGALPLLAFALEQLHGADGTGGRLTLASYQALGTAKGAIGRRAEQVFAELPEAAQAAFGHVFRELVNVDAQGTPTRRRAPRERFAGDEAAGQLIEAFTHRKARLLVADEHSLEVAHEALFRHWPLLEQWIKDYGGDLHLVRQLEAQAAAWQKDPYNPVHRPWPNEAQVQAYAALERLGRSWDTEPEPLRAFLRPEAKRLQDELQDINTPHRRRAEIGDRLPLILPAPRKGTGLVDGLPDIDWVDIAPGTVELEDGAGTFAIAYPFKIARYPVTHAQFRAFAEAADGYRNPAWWGKDAQRHEVVRTLGGVADQPRVTVSWFEAAAFCAWLSARSVMALPPGSVARLPLEWEWQLAATGGDAARAYPWGPWDARMANSVESGLGRTVAVGLYPQASRGEGDGPLDMAGNVWEWCHNLSQEPQRMLTDKDGEAPRVLRGGSWGFSQDACRCACRDWSYPGDRFNVSGFRLVCAPPISETLISESLISGKKRRK